MNKEEKPRQDKQYYICKLSLQARQEQLKLSGAAYMKELIALRKKYYPILSSSLREIRLLQQMMKIEN